MASKWSYKNQNTSYQYKSRDFLVRVSEELKLPEFDLTE